MAGYNPPLFFNLSTNQWIRSVEEPVGINQPRWVYGDTKSLTITFVKSLAGGRVSIVQTITSLLVSLAAAAGSAVLTSAVATGPDAAYAFSFVLPLNVAGVQALKTTNAALEFLLGGVDRYQTVVAILDQVNSGAVAPTPPPDTSLGTNAALSMFVPRDCDQYDLVSISQRIERSADGSKWLITRKDDGSEGKEKLS